MQEFVDTFEGTCFVMLYITSSFESSWCMTIEHPGWRLTLYVYTYPCGLGGMKWSFFFMHNFEGRWWSIWWHCFQTSLTSTWNELTSLKSNCSLMFIKYDEPYILNRYSRPYASKGTRPFENRLSLIHGEDAGSWPEGAFGFQIS